MIEELRSLDMKYYLVTGGLSFVTNQIIMSGIRGCAAQQDLLSDYELKDWVPALALFFYFCLNFG